MFDCIAGYHLNPWTCGIAKFNAILGQRLGVPIVSVLGLEHTRYRRPLLSIKLSEFSGLDTELLGGWIEVHAEEFEVFFHDFNGTETERRLLTAAARVHCGNSELVVKLRDERPDVSELWCPGTILNAKRFEETELAIFTFGMAHKIRVPLYRKLRELLDGTGRSYSVYVSTALHENTSFDGSFVVTFEELQSIFDERIYFMGYLSDTAVYNHLLNASLLAAFFERGLRANNTTVNAAMECGCAVLTNLDEYSPDGLTHLKNVIDIQHCEQLPDLATLAKIGRAASEMVNTRYGWDRLIEALQPAAVSVKDCASN